jgi:hypothetical protein
MRTGLPPIQAAKSDAWIEKTDVDGLNLAYAVTPETFADFVDRLSAAAFGRHQRRRAKAKFSERKPYPARNRATRSSNPSPSSGESREIRSKQWPSWSLRLMQPIHGRGSGPSEIPIRRTQKRQADFS